MSLAAPYSEVYRAGDGITTEFSFGAEFQPISAEVVKCSIYLSDGYEVVPTYIVNMAAGSITISALTMPDGTVLTAPPEGSTVRIYRDVPEAQNITASQLNAYTAKQLEKALDAMVAMIQEVSYTVDHKTVRLTEPQRDIALQELSQADGNHLVYWDFDQRKLVVTTYPHQDVVQCVNGLFFRLRIDPVTQNEYLQWSKDNSDWHSINIDAVNSLAQDAYDLADSAYDLASQTRGELNDHKARRDNPHETSISNLIDVDLNNLVSGQFIMFDGIKWKNVYSSSVATWGMILGDIAHQTDLMTEFAKYVRTDGSSTMTNPLMMRATEDFKCAIAPYWDGVGFFKLNDNNSVTLMASIEYNSGFEPATTNTYDIGASARKWKNLYLSGKAYVSVINNGYDIAVPATSQADTFALMSDVALAANSGTQLYTTGVWYAKMYAASTVPTGAEYDGRNYADFSQVDNDNNPIIVIYEGQSGAWVELTRITPPANYNGYITVTSKIWDIVEQSGQQGGQVLWSHSAKTFTPYPRIISFEDAALTGTPTAPNLDSNSPNNQIVNKASAQAMIDTLDTPELFDYKWKDCLTSKTTWKLADGSWITKAEAPRAYQQLLDEYNNATVRFKQSPVFSSALSGKGWSGCAYFGTEGDDPENFVAVASDGTMACSKDGITWTRSPASQLLTNQSWKDIVYTGVGYGGKWVAIGLNGYVAVITALWNNFSVSDKLGQKYWECLAWNGNKLVALSLEGYVSTSADGITWTTPVLDDNLSTKSGWARVVWNGSMFLAVTQYGYVSTSSDGETWSVPTLRINVSGFIYGLTVYKGKFYAVEGTTGLFYESSDGETWAPCPTQGATLGVNSMVAGTTRIFTLSSSGSYVWPFIEKCTFMAAGNWVTGYIPYYLSNNNKKISLRSTSETEQTAYDLTGNSWFYRLDTANEKFMLPRRRSQKIVRSVSNSDGSWYRLYADGRVEQGGITNTISVAGNSGTNVDVTLPITMANTNYNILTTRKDGGSGYAQTEENTGAISTSVIRITLWNNVSGTASGGQFWWRVSGMSAEDVSDLSEEKYLYFYVGQ